MTPKRLLILVRLIADDLKDSEDNEAVDVEIKKNIAKNRCWVRFGYSTEPSYFFRHGKQTLKDDINE